MTDYRDPNHLDPNGDFSITQLVKFIREKMFGVDVRESIAKALERVYEDASKDGNANMEVSQARGIFSLLKDRLDNSDKEVDKKADRTYVDAVLSSIASGGPKELFYSLSALQAKYPNGAEGTYLVFDAMHTDSAHSYIWTDNQWKDLGAYQAREIENNSITNAKMTEDFRNKLLYARPIGYNSVKGFYSTYTKKFEANSGFNSIRVNVLPGDVFKITNKKEDAVIPLVMFFSDSNQNTYHSHIDYPTGIEYQNHTIIIPNNVYSLGVSARNSYPLQLDKLELINLSEIDENLKYKEEVTNVEIMNGYFHTADSNFVSNPDFKTLKLPLISGTDIYFTSYASTPTVATCVFWQSEGVKLSTVGSGVIKNFVDERATAPNGTAFVTITSGISVIPKIKLNKKLIANEMNERLLLLENSASINQWRGKKIGWIGTSVPFGQNATKSYAKEAADKLGFELVNMSVPGQAIHTNDGLSLTYGSTALSKSEYASQGITIPSSPIPYVPGGAYNSYYRTWENIFTTENADIDLWVFDVVPNNNNFDLTDWNLFDRANWKYTDGSDFADHRSTFLGALLFLMDKMYTLNPNARMVFVLGSAFSYANGKSNLDLLKNSWNIPTIDIWSKVNTSPKSIIKIRSDGGVDNHPSTFGHEVLGNMIANELLLIS